MDYDALSFEGIGKDSNQLLKDLRTTAGTQLNAATAPNRLRWQQVVEGLNVDALELKPDKPPETT